MGPGDIQFTQRESLMISRNYEQGHWTGKMGLSLEAGKEDKAE